MEDDPMEGTSKLFASLCGNASEEQWENYKEQNKSCGFILDSDSDSDYSDTRSLSPIQDEHITNIELIPESDSDKSDEVIDNEEEEEENENDDHIFWGHDAANKYAHGVIDFSELNKIIDNKEIKSPPRKRRCIGKNTKKQSYVYREETQIEKEDREYQMELKNKRKKERKRLFHLPKDLERLMGEAIYNFAQGKTEEAIADCMQLIRLAPTAQEPFHTLSIIYDEEGETRKALQYGLVAAYLNPSDTEEWVRLAEICIEEDQIQQAITCYSKAIHNQPTNMNYLWERCNLYEQINDRKKALIGYELILKQLNSPENGDNCVRMSREIAKVHQENSDYVSAITVLETAFTKFPSLVTSEDVNFLLELHLNQKSYKAAVKNFVQHCGVKLYTSDNEISSYENVENLREEDFYGIEKCFVPDVLPIDLFVKILICLIHLKSRIAVQPLLNSLKNESVKDFGDLYLDVAEACMEVKEYQWAKSFLLQLLSIENWNLPAVWMKYGDTLKGLSEIELAAEAYKQVIKMAPSYQDARLALSSIFLETGRMQDAIHILKQEYEEGNEGSIMSAEVLYQRCKLLESQERWEEFIQAAILLQYSHCYYLETPQDFKAVLSNTSPRRRIEYFREQKSESKAKPKFSSTGDSISPSDMWDILTKVKNMLFKAKRFEELQNLLLRCLTSTKFLKEPEMIKCLEIQALLACYFNKNIKYAYKLVKDLVTKNLNNARAWNLFCLIVNDSQQIKHNRFCLRLMMKHQDHLALGYFNGHNAMISGTYKHALGEYMCILKERPNDSFITFCVAITFIHMACQKFASKRHLLALQGFAFLNQYLKLKGECQETFYNIGRALHQLGIKDAAVYYYKKALFAPVIMSESEKELFDLRSEIAYNLSLIYQSSGAMDLAHLYLRKYVVI